jgi:hypothetical protein
MDLIALLNQGRVKQYGLLSVPIVHRGLKNSGVALGVLVFNRGGISSPQRSLTMPENLLSDAKVKAAKSTDRDWKLSDGGGLFLLVKPTGGKLWRWKYRLQGKENLFAIGNFPK